MVATIGTEEHQRVRKVVSSDLSERALKNQEHLVQKHSDLLVKRLQDIVKGAVKWCMPNSQVEKVTAHTGFTRDRSVLIREKLVQMSCPRFSRTTMKKD